MKIQPLAWIVGFSSLVLVVVGSLRYRMLGRELRILFWLFAASLGIDFITLYMALHKINNHLFYQIGGLFEYAGIALVFSYWQKTGTLAGVIRGSIAIYAVFWIVAKLFFESTKSFGIYSSALSSLLLVLVCSYTFVAVVKENLEDLTQDARFWVLSGVLLIHGTRILLRSLGNVMLELPFEQIVNVMILHWLAVIIANMSFMRAFYCRQVTPKFSGG